jgi:hypothetical protein
VTAIVGSGHSRKGLTAVAVTFDEPIVPGSAGDPSHYSLLGGVKKRRKTIFSKNLAIRGASYNPGSLTVTLTLAKPFQGSVLATVHGGIVASNGAASQREFSATVR